MPAKIHAYSGKDATMTWDAARCIHAAECIRCVPQSFDAAARPWIMPDQSPRTDVLADAVNACPSGALVDAPRGRHVGDDRVCDTSTCEVRADGPYYLRGTLLLAPDITQTRMALCRCGASANKPFCDNAHKTIEFMHATKRCRWPRRRRPATDLATSVTMTPTRNGPLQVHGPLTLRDAAGTTVFVESGYLCRCGGSNNKPYCDGTHIKIGFKG